MKRCGVGINSQYLTATQRLADPLKMAADLFEVINMQLRPFSFHQNQEGHMFTYRHQNLKVLESLLIELGWTDGVCDHT